MPTPHFSSEDILQNQWDAFCTAISKFEQQLHLTSSEFQCDHAAIRVNSIEQADALRVFFENRSKIISENIINGRPILIFKLDQPLDLNGKPVACVELPYPNDKRYPIESWEHIELVIPSNATSCPQLLQDIKRFNPELATIIESPSADIKVKISSPKGENERLPNPTIALKKDNICIKLHPHSIQDIIASEQ
ncbi:MAG: VOC family protein [Parashewanella sp.]